MVACFASVVGFQELYQRYEKTRASLLIPAPLAQDNVHANMFRLAAIIHEAPVLARGAMFEGPLLLDAHR